MNEILECVPDCGCEVVCAGLGVDGQDWPDGQMCPDKACSATTTAGCKYPGWRMCIRDDLAGGV